MDGGNGAETRSGEAGDDRLSGLGGNDLLSGGVGNDTLVAGAALDAGETFDSAKGNDLLDLSAAAGAMRVDLGADRIKGEVPVTLAAIESLISTGAGDKVSGTVGNNRIDGGGGDDLCRAPATTAFSAARATTRPLAAPGAT